MTIKANRIERYYDTHELEGDELTQSLSHFAVINYLITVLQWLFHARQVGVVSNVNFYRTENPKETSISPDIAVVDGLVVQLPALGGMPSYYVGADGPPPRVVFEIASRETWRQDLEEKPARYAAMGVKEYFVYDPTEQPVWTRQWRGYNRLIGWRRNPASGQPELLSKDLFGRLWSAELESWLAVEPEGLRLYTAEGSLRLTEAQAQEQRAEAEYQRAEAEKRKTEAERQRAEKLAEMLRKLGHDPDDVI
jgi:Uma2 family endonuclease